MQSTEGRPRSWTSGRAKVKAAYEARDDKNVAKSIEVTEAEPRRAGQHATAEGTSRIQFTSDGRATEGGRTSAGRPEDPVVSLRPVGMGTAERRRPLCNSEGGMDDEDA